MFGKAKIGAALALSFSLAGAMAAELDASPGSNFQVYYFERAADDDAAGGARQLSMDNTTDDSDNNMTTTEADSNRTTTTTEEATTTQTRTGATSGAPRNEFSWLAACSVVVLSRLAF
mmetsp:Transcript_117244/g.229978  ORF Transcript_117244/g.229978 Transcript_117244/m.229978 type:complete len:118 (-) Transcript_117244:372-725(-)|eukprot:CAMPEP_0170253592 /NCGR_PEP_ID=MMETSP0116_2-20130129/26638_1 /TAXON_ID=400756 /ORGANISM="Durinskia baltica, Strain CSIRO CS-38" /LENGTH=117 /DNA_ID=CAMNT_0010504579 /DNA_START=60 /DNA_END=413 /DNA_ORIENTATION=+